MYSGSAPGPARPAEWYLHSVIRSSALNIKSNTGVHQQLKRYCEEYHMGSSDLAGSAEDIVKNIIWVPQIWLDQLRIL
jgi:hypothetical protein